MKIYLLTIGKTEDKAIINLIDQYSKRLKHYILFEFINLPNIKNTKLPVEQMKIEEGKIFLKEIKESSIVVLLDEKGKEFTSLEFASFIEQKTNSSYKNLYFIVGGAFGFSEEVYKLANDRIAFSKMTFTHDFVRAVFVEQLYRAFTIINKEKYHHK